MDLILGLNLEDDSLTLLDSVQNMIKHTKTKYSGESA